jgi:hypothetical protein
LENSWFIYSVLWQGEIEVFSPQNEQLSFSFPLLFPGKMTGWPFNSIGWCY